MQTTSIKLYSLGYNEAKTYLVATSPCRNCATLFPEAE